MMTKKTITPNVEELPMNFYFWLGEEGELEDLTEDEFFQKCEIDFGEEYPDDLEPY